MMLPDTIILAAGASVRMGSWKPALAWGKKNLLQSIVETVLEAKSHPIVSAGEKFTETVQILHAYQSVDVVFAEHWASGMLESLKAGMTFVRSDIFFVVPCDMPLLKASDFRRLATIYSGQSCRPVLKGQPGHPVLICPQDAEKMVNCPHPEWPVHTVLADSPITMIEWNHRGVIQDMDTPKDYRKLLNSL